MTGEGGDMSIAHDRYVALQRQRNATPRLLDPPTTAFVIIDMPEIHEATLLSFQGPFGRVRRTDEVLALLEARVSRSNAT